MQKLESLDREELIQKFVSLEFNNFLSYYKNAQDLNNLSSSRDRGDAPSGSRGRARDENMTRFFINIGRKDELNPARLIGLINDQRITDNIDIGAIDILDTFSFFEIDKSFETGALEAFEANRPEYNGRNVNIEITNKDRSGGGRGGKRGGGRRRSSDSKGDGGFGRRRSEGGGRSDRRSSSSDRKPRSGGDRPDRGSADRQSGGFGRRRRER